MHYIEFVPSDETPNNNASLWSKPKKSNYSDRIIRPEFAARRLRFGMGVNWFRIVPAIAPSLHGWMLPLHVQNYPGGRFLHPKTLTKNARSAFDHAYAWSKANHPDSLFSKSNKSGVRLLTDPMSICWVIAEEGGRNVARLLMASGYDGSRGGAPGLGYQLWKASRELDENGNVIADAIDPEAGFRVSVEKSQAAGSKYPSYSIRVGRVPAPMAPILEGMDPEEVQALVPLEEVLDQVGVEEQWGCLEKTMAPETVAEIRASLKPAQ